MILQRYVLRELTLTFLAVMGVLLLIYGSQRFVGFLAQAASGNLPSGVVLQLLGLKLLSHLVLVMPLGYFVAALLTFGRLYRDSEITAMLAGGIGLPQLARSMLGYSLGFALLALALALWVSPRAADLGDVLKRQAEEEADVAALVAGRFKALSGGDRVLYAEGLSDDRRSLSNVFVRLRETRHTYILTARSGRLEVDPDTGDRFMVLLDGYRYRGQPGDLGFQVTEFRRQGVRVSAGTGLEGGRRGEATPTLDLIQRDDPAATAEVQWRVSLPLSMAVLGPMAVVLARTNFRQGRYAGVLSGVLIYFVYSNLLGIGRELMQQGRLSTGVGLWPVHLVAAALTLALVLRHVGGTGAWGQLVRRLGLR